MKKSELFYIALVDRDKGVFNVVGPTDDDTAWTCKIVELQSAGRNVNCFTSECGESKESFVGRYSRLPSLVYSDVLISEEPGNYFAEYKGSLPQYAQNANRKRVIRMLCKGSCGITRWAEMNSDYPGDKIFRRSNYGDFVAKCLKCGQEQKDPYNWYR